MGHTQDTPHMKIADLEYTITELEQENRELQISCDGFAEQCSRLQAKIHNIEKENAKLRDALKNIINMAGCCTGEDALNMLETAEYAIKPITIGENR